MPPRNRVRVVFVCQQCSAQSVRWEGRCSECGAWNSLVESIEEESRVASRPSSSLRLAPVSLARLDPGRLTRWLLESAEFNRALGGGIVPGSLVLIGGDPGIGKSTLLLQMSGNVAASYGTILYVSGEESVDQLKLRADRLGINGQNLLVLAETCLDDVLTQIETLAPAAVVIDSIQTMYLQAVPSAPGSVSQVKECALALLGAAKGTGRPIFVVGHVTKDGAIAGPRALEHIVDTVLYLEGERFQSFRILRAVKNRFGSTNEVGVFEMRAEGLADVTNPSEILLEELPAGADGSAVAVTLEGTRPILVEVQALTTTTNFGLPRRTATGVDLNRVLLLSAVLSKRVGLALGNQDIYVNVVGGFRINEPAADLAIATAIASSMRERPVDPKLALIGEVGLSGELRRVRDVDRRVFEAASLGFSRCVIPRSSVRDRSLAKMELELIGADSLAEALQRVWG
ncbi:MAG TPA: DNA repair protein RadA [Chloroflexota bacterium]|nr:DNA repair protein RadA [Chloroflexota bacterium]